MYVIKCEGWFFVRMDAGAVIMCATESGAARLTCQGALNMCEALQERGFGAEYRLASAEPAPMAPPSPEDTAASLRRAESLAELPPQDFNAEILEVQRGMLREGKRTADALESIAQAFKAWAS